MAVDDERLEAAIERLAEADRFAEAETIVARAAPQLQRVLAAALAEGGWFGESHESESLKAATVPDPEQRIAAVRTLLAEEARIGMMVGVAVGWGWIKLVPAWHTSTAPGSEEAPYSAEHGVSLGTAAGLLIRIGEVTVYHSGDTCLFGDMKLIAERNPVDVALLPIGGHYTMDRHDAAVAAELIGAATTIPMHYDTFPPIETDNGAFKAEVESKTSSRVVLLKPGETHTA